MTLFANQFNSLASKVLLTTGGHIIKTYASSSTAQGLIQPGIADYNYTQLQININPQSSSSAFVLYCVLPLSYNYVVGLGFKRNGNKIGRSVSAIQGNMTSNHTYITYKGADNNVIDVQPILEYDAPGTTSTVSYYPFSRNTWAGGNYGFYWNQRASNDMGSSSLFVIWEIA
jgi:hypothetical protein